MGTDGEVHKQHFYLEHPGYQLLQGLGTGASSVCPTHPAGSSPTLEIGPVAGPSGSGARSVGSNEFFVDSGG